MPENPLRLRLAPIPLRLSLVFLLAALPMPWMKGYGTWQLYAGIFPIAISSARAGILWLYILTLPTLALFCLAAPWSGCIRALAGNAPLRWICRVIAVALLLYVTIFTAGGAGMTKIGRGLYPGAWCLILAAYTNAAGLCLLPGRKTGITYYEPSGSD